MPKRDVWVKSPHKIAHEASTEGRYLHFIRHGQYQTADGYLTELGKRQARHLARELARIPLASVVSSDWIRARQTARIVSNALRLTTPKQHRVLRELLPTTVPGMRIPREKRAEGKARLERIIRHFFKPTRGTRHEAIVCHGNLIRALLLRICTGRVVAGWDRFYVHHTGITTFLVTRGGVRIVAYDRVAHLPQRCRTRT